MSWRLVVIIIALTGLYLLGNGSVQLWDRDEPRYAQTSRQMLASGDWVVPRLLDQPRINKPPLIYWCQASAMRLFGNEVFAARFPSAVAITLTLILLALALRRSLDPQTLFWTIVIFGTSGLVVMAAKMCLTDAVLLLFVTISQLCIYALWRGNTSWPVIITLGISMGLAMLTKGPVALGINATTLVVLGILRWFDHRYAARRGFEIAVAPDHFEIPQSPASPAEPADEASLKLAPAPAPKAIAPAATITESPVKCSCWMSILARTLVVIGIILAIGLPWVLALESRLQGGLANTLKHDVLKRMTTPLEQHKGPPGYYLAFFLATFFPWCLFLPAGIKLAWNHRTAPLIRFSLAAVIGPWIMFELIQTKLPHYVLPCFPFLAILTAQALVGAIRQQHEEWRGKVWMFIAGCWTLALIAMGLAPWFAMITFESLPIGPMVLVTATTGLVGGIILPLFANRRYVPAAGTMALATVLVLALLFGLYLPQARFLHLSEDVGDYLQSIGATEKGQVYMIDYKEDTLPFYQGGTIRPQPKNLYLAEVPPDQWPRYFVITREIWDSTPKERQAHLDVLKTFRGWAYAAKGRVVEVMVVRKRET